LFFFSLMQKILFLDRDGTLVQEPPETFQVNSLEEMVFLPNVISSLKKLVETDFKLIMVTNQDGLGTDKNPRENYEKINAKMFEIFASEGIFFSHIFECSHFSEENCSCRKPKIGILGNFLETEKFDKNNSYMIGDRKTDLEFAKNIGVVGFLLDEKNDWRKITKNILETPRIGKIARKTKETEIIVEWNLDGNGKYEIDTGLKFFDHMLEQLGKHGNFDLKIFCKGDLEIDEHHTIEDTAIVLGEAFLQALGDKRGIVRYAHDKILPMDEALAQVALDISGRPHLEFSGHFTREYVGDFPTEMLKHFYKSFCDSAKINLNLKLEGENTHHLIEISFKAFARVLKDAVKVEGTSISSTKGVL